MYRKKNRPVNLLEKADSDIRKSAFGIVAEARFELTTFGL